MTYHGMARHDISWCAMPCYIKVGHVMSSHDLPRRGLARNPTRTHCYNSAPAAHKAKRQTKKHSTKGKGIRVRGMQIARACAGGGGGKDKHQASKGYTIPALYKKKRDVYYPGQNFLLEKGRAPH